MAESTTTPCAVALLSISSCLSCTLDWVYMSLNSPVAPSSTCRKFSSTSLESMLVSTTCAVGYGGLLCLLTGQLHLMRLPLLPAEEARNRK